MRGVAAQLAARPGRVRHFRTWRRALAEQRDVDREMRHAWQAPPASAWTPPEDAPQRVRRATLERLFQAWEARPGAATLHDELPPSEDGGDDMERHELPVDAPPLDQLPMPPDDWIDDAANEAERGGPEEALPSDIAALFLADPDAALEAGAARRREEAPEALAPETPVAPAAPTSHTPRRGVRDQYDWRLVAVSQQGVALPGHTYTHLVGPAWDADQWAWVRRKPPQSLLLRAAHRAARAVHRAPHDPGHETSAMRALTLGARQYQQHWRRVLSYERAHHEDELHEQRSRPLHELVALGLAVPGLMAFWQTGRHFGRRVGVFKLPGSRRLPRHKLQPGSVVDLCPEDAPPDWLRMARRKASAVDAAAETLAGGAPGAPERVVRVPAEVIDVTPTQVRVRFSEAWEHLDLGLFERWRLDRGESNVTNERTEAALDAMLYEPDDVVRAGTPQRRYALAGTTLRDVLTGQASVTGPGLFAQDQRIHSWCERYARARPVRVEGDPELGLNRSQLRAVAMMLRERVSLVQGPPGTGKTRTLVQAVRLLKQHFQVPHPVLLAAHTNVAVDNLVEGCVRAGLTVVRAGSSTAARASVADHTLDAHLARHASAPALAEAEAALKESQATREALEAALRQGQADKAMQERAVRVRRAIAHLTARCHVLRQRMYADVLHRADVVCSTAIAAGSAQLNAIDFPLVFLDEGSMATEPIALIPLMKGCAQLALVGDHKQLPPVLQSTAARRAGLSTSLFERLIRGDTVPGAAHARCAVPSTMLDVQFRMHPLLARFPNVHFYDGALRDAPSTESLGAYDSVFAAYDAMDEPLPLTLLTHAPVASSSSAVGAWTRTSGASPYNPLQADLCLELVCDLLERNPTLRGADIGIVTPYEAQVRLLQRMLAAGESLATGGDAMASTVPQLSEDALDTLAAMDARRASELSAIEVHTVDGFEGREKPVMVFSTVKASGGSVEGTAALHWARERPSEAAAARLESLPRERGGFIGFLADRRRMNVALTRAQRQLFVVGNLETLLCARLGDHGAEHIECSDVHVVRKYARWLLAHGHVVDVQQVRDRQLEGWRRR
ncbi:unnamed protein product [Malassezia sympodialis ATCC 42132]|uniref:Similar to S.cerevisiae protein NAM7 (ATP-dependent RNA helicase of the SFI superfamily) n=1 Tax=Malassezia sympodialis (strain ATCC 42132) TaxID=1230383 RepID=M5E9L0_MALS4|nr:uncharacterized protein MSY001_1798 [Malassezia sympodialis ATCC 42132]CCU99092.1 unnamed protein product [Malassezia sympodialis ATCC 42132]SHO78322.1 Similar to S.cerevisiae protein NAM7 (ATP-dependent RNA helicase of the SFI superfamily) [Malassezia sympodialis ATCC 42132]|eukprot:XP_018740360.1 uncharacterized protein MSY001_1798 [Malassezia sympodialis ATCC 42132]